MVVADLDDSVGRFAGRLGVIEMSDLDILRRIAKRGLKQAQSRSLTEVDIWQHLLDEIERVDVSLCAVCGGVVGQVSDRIENFRS